MLVSCNLTPAPTALTLLNPFQSIHTHAHPCLLHPTPSPPCLLSLIQPFSIPHSLSLPPPSPPGHCRRLPVRAWRVASPHRLSLHLRGPPSRPLGPRHPVRSSSQRTPARPYRNASPHRSHARASTGMQPLAPIDPFCSCVSPPPPPTGPVYSCLLLNELLHAPTATLHPIETMLELAQVRNPWPPRDPFILAWSPLTPPFVFLFGQYHAHPEVQLAQARKLSPPRILCIRPPHAPFVFSRLPHPPLDPFTSYGDSTMLHPVFVSTRPTSRPLPHTHTD